MALSVTNKMIADQEVDSAEHLLIHMVSSACVSVRRSLKIIDLYKRPPQKNRPLIVGEFLGRLLWC
jgi:hypothetical protein